LKYLKEIFRIKGLMSDLLKIFFFGLFIWVVALKSQIEKDLRIIWRISYIFQKNKK